MARYKFHCLPTPIPTCQPSLIITLPMASFQISRTDRKEVYLSRQVRRIFIQPRYAQLRQAKKIREVVNQHHLSVWIYSTESLVQILRSLLKDHIFESRNFAQEAFPDLFPSTKPSNAPPSNQISKPPGTLSSMPKSLQQGVETELLPALDRFVLMTSPFNRLISSH